MNSDKSFSLPQIKLHEAQIAYSRSERKQIIVCTECILRSKLHKMRTFTTLIGF